MSESFYAYDSDGVRLWVKDLGEDIEATAVIDKTGGPLDGNVYVGTADDNAEPDGRVYGFAPDATGQHDIGEQQVNCLAVSNVDRLLSVRG